MKKRFETFILIAFLVLAMAVPCAFAGDDNSINQNQQQGIGNNNTANGQGGVVSVFSPSATGGSVGAITNTNTANGGAGGAGGTGGNAVIQSGAVTVSPTFSPSVSQSQGIKDSGNSTNLIGNGIGNFSPEASATIQKGAITNTVSPTISPTNTNTNNVTNKDIGNVTIGGGFLSKTLSPEANANVDNKNVNINKPVNIVDTDIKNTNKQGQSQSNTNTFNPTNTNTQGQDQKQKQQQNQKQGQDQSQNNAQNIAPVQEVTFKSPTQLMNPPSQMVPELNFGSGRMKDVTSSMPNFAIFGIKKYAGEAILDVIDVNANVKFKNYFKEVISVAKEIAGPKGEYFGKSNQVRIMVVCAEAQKSWSTGGNLGGATSLVSATGLAGGSGAGSIVPNWGGTKADDLFTIIYVKVIPAS